VEPPGRVRAPVRRWLQFSPGIYSPEGAEREYIYCVVACVVQQKRSEMSQAISPVFERAVGIGAPYEFLHDLAVLLVYFKKKCTEYRYIPICIKISNS